MRRGDLVTIAGRIGGDYDGKPRPAVIIQSNDFPETDSVTVSLLTSIGIDAPLLRLRIDPAPANNLRQTSWLMIDKIATVRRRNMGAVFGRLSDAELVQLNRALPVFLGIAG
ncbi:type II toxin-antitoxin system PemK/MazF family toxin (plasmid) [Skermanella sp. TT6]|uniref:Type II toxin-antitoxin system PemK/MazF family toxin n=1 Tax=Skermanella cutis TaxID=2775420 RepID=A0ABX7BEK1_9PROT|nr:type II toxin-antitoxin system PemK/MazF family toxin [Skermanella sp. TT6]QQP92845.1 type II toxin-antitoxin system PemK/MazF family toxin [Skermanella sp. TT6]